MTYIPAPGDRAYIVGRPSTLVDVLAVDLETGLMWVRSQGGRPITAVMDGRWMQVVDRPLIPDTWHAITLTATSRGFATRTVVVANLPADAIALMHVSADATVTFEWIDPQ